MGLNATFTHPMPSWNLNKAIYKTHARTNHPFIYRRALSGMGSGTVATGADSWACCWLWPLLPLWWLEVESSTCRWEAGGTSITGLASKKPNG